MFITVINEYAEVILIQIRAIRQRTEKHLSAALVVYPPSLRSSGNSQAVLGSVWFCFQRLV